MGGYPFWIKTTGAPGPFPEGTEVFAGTRDWHLVEFDLADFSGSVRLRFRFGTNIVTEMEGWFIDDVVVDGFNVEFSDIPQPELRAVLILSGGDPNPFGTRTQLRYTLPRECEVVLQVFDLGGRLVRTLVRDIQVPGAHMADWDGCDKAACPMPSGVYLTRLRAGSQEATTKLILSR